MTPEIQGLRLLARTDLHYLIRWVFKRKDFDHPWLIERCREVQANPNGCLDLWARDHRKSTIITYALTIQDILASHGDDPLPKWNGLEPTFGIFSHTRPIAKKFLRQIKHEFETNKGLKELFPDILWDNPQKQSPKWSEDDGIVLRRKSNPKEATVEAWGLVDGQPVGAHFNVRVYDDVVTRASVNTPDMIAKTTESWELSQNLGTTDGFERYIGTRYAIFDTYQEMMTRGAAKVRLYPATDDGTESGTPVFLTPAQLAKKRRDMGATTFSAQMLQRPVSKGTATFDIEHLKFADVRPRTLNVAILGDPAHSKRKGSDRTAILVIAKDAQRNLWLLDGYNHKMNLKERWDALSTLRRKWMNEPGVTGLLIGYERYGLQADIEHFKTQMELAEDVFDIEELNWPKEGPGAKDDRIARLRPDFERRRFNIPILAWHEQLGLCYLKVEKGEIKYVKAETETANMRRMANAGLKYLIVRPIKRIDEDGRLYDVTVRFIQEYLAHPAPGAFKDVLDAASRLYDLDLRPPVVIDEKAMQPETFHDS